MQNCTNLVDLENCCKTNISYLLAKFGFDTTENEPSKVWQSLAQNHFRRIARFAAKNAVSQRNMHFSLKMYISLCRSRISSRSTARSESASRSPCSFRERTSGRAASTARLSCEREQQFLRQKFRFFNILKYSFSFATWHYQITVSF